MNSSALVCRKSSIITASATLAISSHNVARVRCTLDGVAAACSPAVATVHGLTSGAHTFTVTASDAAGNAAVAHVTWTADATPPTAGTIDYSDGVSDPVSGVFAAGTDAHAVTAVLQRATAPYTQGTDTCGAFSEFAPVNGLETSPFTDVDLPDLTCAMYRVVTTDAVGNTSVGTSAHVAKHVVGP